MIAEAEAAAIAVAQSTRPEEAQVDAVRLTQLPALEEVWPPDETPPDVPVYLVRVQGPLPSDIPTVTLELLSGFGPQVVSGEDAAGPDDGDRYFVIVDAETGRVLMTGTAHEDWP